MRLSTWNTGTGGQKSGSPNCLAATQMPSLLLLLLLATPAGAADCDEAVQLSGDTVTLRFDPASGPVGCYEAVIRARSAAGDEGGNSEWSQPFRVMFVPEPTRDFMVTMGVMVLGFLYKIKER